MEKLKLGSYQEQYEINKLQMIKTKKGRIVSLHILEDLKKTDSDVDINVNILFKPEVCIQKHIFNQGFLLPYKISKKLEKAKLILFLLVENNQISDAEYQSGVFDLNVIINQVINEILEKHTKKHFEVAGIKIEKV